MASKIYAIKKGFDFINNKEVENIKVYSWADCQKYTKGVKGAIYKSFLSEGECDEYLRLGSSSKKEGKDMINPDVVRFYVDGSYNSKTKEFAYAYVAIKGDVIIAVENGKMPVDKSSNTRQVAGELVAAVKSAQFAIKNNIKHISIHHDYMGIRNHATGEWSRKEESSARYYKTMQNFFKQGLNVEFVKVDAHTNVLFNEMADELCKIKLNIPSKKIIDSYLKTNNISVENNSIKNILSELTSNSDNIFLKLTPLKKSGSSLLAFPWYSARLNSSSDFCGQAGYYIQT